MKNKRRVGVYGGTFNPPHVAHVRVAEHFAKAMALDELIIIPSNLPPHKEFSGTVRADERLEMTRLAFSHIDSATVSDIEMKRGGKSYTVDTLRALSSVDSDLYFLLGTDMLLTLDSWYMPDEIFKLATICYVRRESDPEVALELLRKENEYRERFGAKIVAIDADVIEISSTEIRNALKGGVDNEMIPKSVLEYIRQRGLYR